MTNENIEQLYQCASVYNSNTTPSILLSWYNRSNKLNVTKLNDNLLEVNLYPEYSDTHSKTLLATSPDKKLNENDFKVIAERIKSKTRPYNSISLTLIDEQVAKVALSSRTKFTNDYVVVSRNIPAYFDYIYSTHDNALIVGKKFEDHRRRIRRYHELYPDTDVKICKLSEIGTQNLARINQLINDWYGLGTDGAYEQEDHYEWRVFNNLYDLRNRSFTQNINVILISIKGKLVSFSIFEVIDKFAVSHFHKSNLNVSYIAEFSFNILNKKLDEMGAELLNFQEDLGIRGLRQFKKRMHPYYVAEQYKIVKSTLT